MDKIIVLDFGGQYCHLISRRIRSFGVACEIIPSDTSARAIAKDKDIKGIILSGGARSVYEKDAPPFDRKVLGLPLPMLGICYGHQLIAHLLGGKVRSGEAGEYGLMKLEVIKAKGVFAGMDNTQNVWMNHRDVVTDLPTDFISIGKTKYSKIAAFANLRRNIDPLQNN